MCWLVTNPIHAVRLRKRNLTCTLPSLTHIHTHSRHIIEFWSTPLYSTQPFYTTFIFICPQHTNHFHEARRRCGHAQSPISGVNMCSICDECLDADALGHLRRGPTTYTIRTKATNVSALSPRRASATLPKRISNARATKNNATNSPPMLTITKLMRNFIHNPCASATPQHLAAMMVRARCRDNSLDADPPIPHVTHTHTLRIHT